MFDFYRNSGIHTFELECPLCYDLYQTMRENLFILSRAASSRFFRKGNYYKCEAYSEHGISILLNPSLLKLIINPSRLIKADDFIGLYAPNRHNVIPKELPHKLRPYLEPFLPYEIYPRLSVSRVDYTIDVLLPSDKYVLLMIKLAKKNGLPRGFEETYPAKIRNSPNFNNSFSYDVSHTSGAFRVTLYAKHKQLLSRKNIPQNMLDGTEGLLRSEVSCRFAKNDIPFCQDKGLDNLFTPERLISIYQDAIPQLFPYGAYLKSPMAKALIAKYYHRQRTLKKHLLDFLDSIITCHSFHDGYKRLRNKNIPKKTLLESFYNIGVSPVTIAVNDKIPCLPSIYSLLHLPNPYAELEKSMADIEKQDPFHYN